MRRLALTALTALTALALLASCSSTPDDPREANEADFIEAARFDLSVTDPADEAQVSDDELLMFGYLACKELEAGRVTNLTLVPWMTQQYPDMPSAQSAALQSLVLCPDWFK